MTHTTRRSSDCVVLEPATPADASVIWLHGLGADGFDFVPIAGELALPADLAVRFIFPHAEPRPVTINNGYVMRAWYDITSLGAGRVEDESGIRASEAVVKGYIEREIAAGVPASRIVLAGFSQGGAIALHTGLRYPQRLAGLLGLSTYLPLHATLEQQAAPANRDTPILMCHGTRDAVVAFDYGRASCDALLALGYAVEWRSYPMEHQVCMEEVRDVSEWLQARLTRNR